MTAHLGVGTGEAEAAILILEWGFRLAVVVSCVEIRVCELRGGLSFCGWLRAGSDLRASLCLGLTTVAQGQDH